jgi:hypothetical protein
MSDPASAPPPPPPAKKPVLVVPRYSKKELIYAIFVAVTAFAVIIGLYLATTTKSMATPMRGVVQGRFQTGVRETWLDTSRRGVKGSLQESGFYLKVYVEKEKKTYDVMVSESDWKRYQDGDPIYFMPPGSEQPWETLKK